MRVSSGGRLHEKRRRKSSNMEIVTVVMRFRFTTMSQSGGRARLA